MTFAAGFQFGLGIACAGLAVCVVIVGVAFAIIYLSSEK